MFTLTKENVSVKFSKPWWNDQCEQAIKIKHQAKNPLYRHPTMVNYELFKVKSKSSDKIIKDAKEKSFRDFISGVKVDKLVNVLWNRVSCL